MKAVIYKGDKISDYLKIFKINQEKKKKEAIINKSNTSKQER